MKIASFLLMKLIFLLLFLVVDKKIHYQKKKMFFLTVNSTLKEKVNIVDYHVLVIIIKKYCFAKASKIIPYLTV